MLYPSKNLSVSACTYLCDSSSTIWNGIDALFSNFLAKTNNNLENTFVSTLANESSTSSKLKLIIWALPVSVATNDAT